MGKTKIPWTDRVWNPIRGCSHVSPGCDHCYAERMAARFPWGEKIISGGHWNGHVDLLSDKLGDPLRWRTPGCCFVASVSDPFHTEVPFKFLAAMFGVMACAPTQTFQLLTKRPGRMLSFFNWLEDMAISSISVFPYDHLNWRRAHILRSAALNAGVNVPTSCADMEDAGWPLPNVWLGVTAEDQQRADERIPMLMLAQAAVRFVSVEPMLGPVSLNSWLTDALHQVIIGCEKGPWNRPMKIEWARALARQADDFGADVFVKQINGPNPGTVLTDPDDFPEDLRTRECPRTGGKS